MLAVFGRWIAGKWASAAASNYLAIIGVVLASVLIIYVQQLRLHKAKCKADQASIQRYSKLADRLAIELEKDRDAIIKSLENSTSPCLDMSVSRMLGNKTPSGTLQDD